MVKLCVIKVSTINGWLLFLYRQDSKSTSLGSPKVSRKYFTNWKQACDKTKDRTKELLKRWRTLPESEAVDGQMQPAEAVEEEKHPGWSVHVWSKYLKYFYLKFQELPDRVGLQKE